MGLRRDCAASPQLVHGGCISAVGSRDPKQDLGRDGDLPMEQKGLEGIGYRFWGLPPPGIQQIKQTCI